MRYRVDDLPGIGAGAFTPVPSTNPIASSFGLVHVTASWGTDANVAPAPPAIPALTARGKSPNTAQSSDVSPDAMLPAGAIPSTANMGPERGAARIGMMRRRLNELPMPALDATRLALPAQSAPPAVGRP